MTAIWDAVTGIFGTVTTLLTLLTPIFILVSGIVSLFFGRKLFWVFVAAIGFLLGLYLADILLPLLPEEVGPYKEFVRLAIALTFAGVALIVQRAGTILAGAIACGALAWWGAGQWEMVEWGRWAFAGVAGLMGAVLLYFALEWMLLVLTALAGGLIAITGMNELQGVPVGTGPWLYLVLVVAGFFYQRRELVQDSRARAAALPVAAPAPAPVPVAKRTRRNPFRRLRLRRSARTSAIPALPESELMPLEGVAPSASAPAGTSARATLPPPVMHEVYG